MSSEPFKCPDFAEILRNGAPDDPLRELLAGCFHAELGRFARAICGDATVAEDVAHDALMQGLALLQTYRGDAPLRAWLRRLVRSACSRFHRGRKNKPFYNVPLSALPEESAAMSSEPVQESQVLVKEQLAQLRGALEHVAEPNRSLLLLHEGMDIPLTELAARFELTTDAVKARLRRTRARVREVLLERLPS